ncbi:MAG: DUF294 nucleotidyltransferase-like domain-containing protein, partial [Desulfosarcina sp.]
MKAGIIRFLSSMPHFSFLKKEELDRVVSNSELIQLPKGEPVSTQGETRIENVLVVMKGQLSLYQDVKGDQQLSGYIKQGEVYGGISVMLNAGIALRTAQVDSDLHAISIPSAVIMEICTKNKAFHAFFLENFSQNIFDESLDDITRAAQARLFLSGVGPFTFLPEEEIERVAQSLSLVSYLKGTVLFVQGKTRVGYLYILQKGAVERYYEEKGEKKIRELMSEGDIYGGISMLLHDGLSVRTMEVVENATFWVMPSKLFFEICKKYSAFSDFFSDTFGKRMLSRSYAAIIAKTLHPKEDGLQFFNQPLSQIFSRDPVFCDADDSIRDTANTMLQRKSSYAFIRSKAPKKVGIVTDKDFARKVIAKGYPIDKPVASIMSSPLRTVSEKALVFEAMMTMMEEDFQHIGVVDGNNHVIGMLSNKDLITFQGQSPLFVLREIQTATHLEAIVEKHNQLPVLVRSLIHSGATAQNVTRFITTVSDTILNKLMAITVDDLGPPPVPFVFMILGSEGRQEQTLKTDQDNAIVYQDPQAGASETVRSYFQAFGNQACRLLNQVGYDYCTGDVMAKNPRWCQSLGQWKTYFSDWIYAAEAEDLLQASIFFDFRHGFGEASLIGELRRHLFNSLEGWSGFFRHMTENALHFKPPLGFFRNFVVESKGKHRNAFDIKSAMTPIVDFARVYALRSSIEETNTLDRLHQLRIRKILSLQ